MRATLTGLALVCFGALDASGADFERTVPAEAGGTLRVELSGGPINVESHDDAEVRIEAWTSGWGARTVRFELEHDGRDVRFKESRASWFGGPRVEVRVRVPEFYSVDLRTAGGHVEVDDLNGEVAIHTSGGRIEVDRVEGPVRVKSSGGPIRAEEIRGSLNAETSGGGIHVSDSIGELRVRTSGGPIELRDVTGPVRGRTSGGPIFARFTASPEGSLETSGGPIEVVLPAGIGIRLDARTSGGRITIDDDLAFSGSFERNEARGEISGGGPELRLRTSGGGIEIHAR